MLALIGLTNILTTGCSQDQTMRRLENADALMEVDPEAALDTLCLIDPEPFRANHYQGETGAYYALLFTLAQIRNNIVVDNDSIIEIAWQYYAREGETDGRIRSGFLSGKILYNMRNMPMAMERAVTAYELAKKAQKPLWIARTAELMYDIFMRTFKYEEALEYNDEAITNYELAGKTVNHRYALVDKASALLEIDRYLEAESLLDSMFVVCRNENPVDSNYLNYIADSYCYVTLGLGKFDFYESISDSLDRFSEQMKHSIQLNYYIDSRQPDKADSILDLRAAEMETLSDTLDWMTSKYLIAKQRADYPPIALLADSVLLMQIKLLRTVFNESVTATQRDYYHNEANDFRDEAADYKTWIGWLSFLLSSLLLVTFIYQSKLRIKRSKLETALASLSDKVIDTNKLRDENSKLQARLQITNQKNRHLIDELEGFAAEKEKNKEALQAIYRDKWRSLSALSNEYFELDSEEEQQKIVLSNIKKQLENLRSSKTLRQIESDVNQYMDNVMGIIRKDCRFLTKDQIGIVTLSLAGLSGRTIAYLYNLNIKQFYTKRQRLFKRILDSTTSHRELFEQYLS